VRLGTLGLPFGKLAVDTEVGLRANLQTFGFDGLVAGEAKAVAPRVAPLERVVDPTYFVSERVGQRVEQIHSRFESSSVCPFGVTFDRSSFILKMTQGLFDFDSTVTKLVEIVMIHCLLLLIQRAARGAPVYRQVPHRNNNATAICGTMRILMLRIIAAHRPSGCFLVSATNDRICSYDCENSL